jgi:hypothetical protein
MQTSNTFPRWGSVKAGASDEHTDEQGLAGRKCPWGVRSLSEHGGPATGAQTAWNPRDWAAPSHCPPDRPHTRQRRGPSTVRSRPQCRFARAARSHEPSGASRRWTGPGRAPAPCPFRSFYLGLQPRWRPGQAGAGTAEVRGRHVLLVQSVVGCLPHSQVTVGRGQSEIGLFIRGEGAGNPRRDQGVVATTATRRHCCSGSAAATCSPLRMRTGTGRGLQRGSGAEGAPGAGGVARHDADERWAGPLCGRWPRWGLSMTFSRAEQN